MTGTHIASVFARGILDGRGMPTLEVDIRLADGALGRAAVPSGGSRGRRESTPLREFPDAARTGPGVASAVTMVDAIAASIIGLDANDRVALDLRLLELDGTESKSRLGGNVILGISLASARAAAASAGVPVYQHLGGSRASTLPVPLFDVINGGAHADNDLDLEEFMIAPVAASSFAEALRWGAECFAALRSILAERGLRTSLGDLGGFAPDLGSNEKAFALLVMAIERAGLEPGRDVVLAVDASANALFDGAGYGLIDTGGTRLDSDEFVDLWARWARAYPIWYLEDGLAEDDFGGWKALTRTLGRSVTLAGDDVFVTDADTISSGVLDGVGNAVLIKLDQVGTLTEALDALDEAGAGRYGIIVAGRQGDTTDDFIADFAVATGAGAMKGGAPSRGERVAKYNQLLRIEQDLGARARYAGPLGVRRRPSGAD